jgi:hypothetical protein
MNDNGMETYNPLLKCKLHLPDIDLAFGHIGINNQINACIVVLLYQI